jgi:uncharacterized protein YycO
VSALSIIFTRQPDGWKRLLDAPIRVWEGDDASHCAVRIGPEVIDATALHGVKRWAWDEWHTRRHIVDEFPVYPVSHEAARVAVDRIRSRLGAWYDYLGIIGFPLLRDLGMPDAFWCSELVCDFWADCQGADLPGRSGRRGVRLTRWLLHGQRTEALQRLTRA